MGDLDIERKTPRTFFSPDNNERRYRDPIVNPSFSFLSIPIFIQHGWAKTRNMDVLLISTPVLSESSFDSTRLEYSFVALLEKLLAHVSK